MDDAPKNFDSEASLTPVRATSNMDKRTSRVIELQRQLQYKLKFNIVDELIDLYRCGSTKPADRIRILLELLRYQFPQLKAIEVDQREGEKIHVNITFPDDTTKKIVDVEKTLAEFHANN